MWFAARSDELLYPKYGRPAIRAERNNLSHESGRIGAWPELLLVNAMPRNKH